MDESEIKNFDEGRKEHIEAVWCIDSEDANVEYLIDLKTSKVLMVRNRNDKQ